MKALSTTFKNISTYTISSFLIQIISFILFPVIANELKPENFGKLNYFNTIYLYLSAFSILGYSNFISRQCPRTDDQIPLVIAYLKLKFLFTFIISLVYSICILYFDLQNIAIHIFLVMTLLISIPDFRWFYIANERLYLISYVNLFAQIIFFIVVLFLIHIKKVNFYTIFIIQIFTNLIPIFYFIYLFLKDHKINLKFNNIFSFSRSMIHECFHFGLISIIANLNVYFSIFWITKYMGFSSQGIYSVAYKFVLLVNLFFNLVGQVYSPIISKYFLKDTFKLRKKIKEYFLLSLVIGFLAVVFIKFLVPIIFRFLFSSKYVIALPIIDFFSMTLIPLQIFSICFSNILMATKFSKQVLIALFLGTSVYFVLILFFINTKSIYSIINSQVAMELLILGVLAGCFLYYRKDLIFEND